MNGDGISLLGVNDTCKAGALNRSDISEDPGHLDLDSPMDLLHRATIHEVCERFADHLTSTPTEHVANCGADVQEGGGIAEQTPELALRRSFLRFVIDICQRE